LLFISFLPNATNCYCTAKNARADRKPDAELPGMKTLIISQHSLLFCQLTAKSALQVTIFETVHMCISKNTLQTMLDITMKLVDPQYLGFSEPQGREQL
jgi:hypothetical protein